MTRPEWVKEPARTLDARAMIEGGEHPLALVMAGLDAMGAGDVFLLVTPFVPAPLVQKAKDKGFTAWTDSSDADVVKTYFTKAG